MPKRLAGEKTNACAIGYLGIGKRSSAPVLRTTSSPNFGLARMDSTQDVSPSQPVKYRSSSASVASDDNEATNFACEKEPVIQRSLEYIRLVKGQLACQKVDVIVNSTSASMQLEYGAVSKSLLQAAGPGLQSECKRKYPYGIQPGDLAETSGCKMNCKVIDTFMKSCLQTADESEFVSIAFPAFGTGHLGYPKEQVANTMFSCVETFFRRHPKTSLQDVRFVVYDKDFTTVKAFEEEQEKRQIGHNSNSQFAQDDFVKSADNKDKRQHSITLSSSAPIKESNSYMDMKENLRKKM
ncbi:unnamed protein product [Mytilus edulis]|uniref:Macro domain-containing protein n=1 Tax=Mytilus edulis TaxID=6550 RepID=A0A8S3SBK0_MYTED|nr:unnamed protein product [Mytilus edulis]